MAAKAKDNLDFFSFFLEDLAIDNLESDKGLDQILGLTIILFRLQFGTISLSDFEISKFPKTFSLLQS